MSLAMSIQMKEMEEELKEKKIEEEMEREARVIYFGTQVYQVRSMEIILVSPLLRLSVRPSFSLT